MDVRVSASYGYVRIYMNRTLQAELDCNLYYKKWKYVVTSHQDKKQLQCFQLPSFELVTTIHVIKSSYEAHIMTVQIAIIKLFIEYNITLRSDNFHVESGSSAATKPLPSFQFIE